MDKLLGLRYGIVSDIGEKRVSKESSTSNVSYQRVQNFEMTGSELSNFLGRPSYNQPMYEFVLWSNCNNNCQFCWQKYLNKPKDYPQMVQAIQSVRNYLPNLKNGCDILLVGGEIFCQKEIQQDFMALAYEICQKLINGDIRYFYINTNLLYNDTSFLFEFLDIFKQYNLFNKLKFTTSWDVVGRFGNNRYDEITTKTEKIWETNMRATKEHFPDCNIVVNMILTHYLCEFILLHGFDLPAFKEDFKCDVNLIPYIPYVKDRILTHKKVVFSALEKCGLDIKPMIDSLDLKQDKHIFECKDDTLVDITETNSECGHNKNFCKATEDNSCYVCELKKIF